MDKNSITNTNKNTVIDFFLGISLTLIFIRFPITGILNLQNYTRITLVVPFFVLFFPLCSKIDIKKIINDFFQLDLLKNLLIINFVILFFCFIYHFSINYSYHDVLSLVRNTASTSLFLIFPTLLLALDFSQARIQRLLDYLCSFIVIVGGSIFFTELFLYHPLLIKNEVIADEIALRNFYLGNVNNSIHQITVYSHSYGLLANINNSLTAMMGSSIYLLNRALYGNLTDCFSKLFIGISITAGLIPLLFAESITPLLIAVTCVGISFLRKLTSKNIKYLIPIGILAGAVIAFSKPADRLHRYFTSNQHLLDRFFPTFSGCTFSNLFLRGQTNESVRLCNFGEFHIFDFPQNSGFLPFIAWFLILFVFLSYAGVVLKQFPYNQINTPPFMLGVSILLSSIHYAPITSWGNNFLFTMSLVFLYQSKNPAPILENVHLLFNRYFQQLLLVTIVAVVPLLIFISYSYVSQTKIIDPNYEILRAEIRSPIRKYFNSNDIDKLNGFAQQISTKYNLEYLRIIEQVNKSTVYEFRNKKLKPFPHFKEYMHYSFANKDETIPYFVRVRIGYGDTNHSIYKNSSIFYIVTWLLFFIISHFRPFLKFFPRI
ncbi:MAG: hypothetical protein ACQ9MH_24200 [Nitrospinales bacterium]